MKLVLSDTGWEDFNLDALENKETGEKLSFQYSYYYARDKQDTVDNIRKYSKADKVYIDSGVFTARKRNEVIPTQDLIDFYLKNSDIIDYVFTMDEGSIQEQLANCKQMADAGVPVIGIYHPQMPLDYIERMHDMYPYIALSFWFFRKFNLSTDIFWEYIYKKNLFPIKVHALGIESWDVLSHAPYYSTDASTIVKAYIYGNVSKFNKKKIKIDMKHPIADVMEVLKMDHNAFDYIGADKESRKKRILQSIHERFAYQTLITKAWEERGIIWQD